MRGVALLILLALLAETCANELAANTTSDAQNSKDKLASKRVSKFIDRLFNQELKAAPLPCEAMDNTTLGKPSHLAIPSSTNPKLLVSLPQVSLCAGGSHHNAAHSLPYAHRLRPFPSSVLQPRMSTRMMAASQPRVGMTSTPNKVAFITGGQQGIGKEIARKLVDSGVTTILGCLDVDLGSKVAEELGGDVRCVYLQLNDLASIQAARDFISKEFGRLDVLINNAAICFNHPTLYGKIEPKMYWEYAPITINTNFFGTLNVIRTMLPLLRTSGSPRIVTVASDAGKLQILSKPERIQAFIRPDLTIEQIEFMMREFVGDVESSEHEVREKWPYYKDKAKEEAVRTQTLYKGWAQSVYGMSNLGLIQMSRVLARDEPQIMINCVDPGYCATAQNNFTGRDTPEEGARAAADLALIDDGRRITGGYWMRSPRPFETIVQKMWF